MERHTNLLTSSVDLSVAIQANDLKIAIFADKMSLLRSATRLGLLSRQCTRLATAQQQSRRNYADMSFTFASCSSVSTPIN